MSKAFDTLIHDVRIVRPGADDVEYGDIAIAGGKFAAFGPALDPADAVEVIDGRGQLAFPGLVDAHTHMGIYQPLEEDAELESRAAAAGGVTTLLTYMRTGQYYLDEGGDYAEFYPMVLARSRDHYWVDYAYHLAPIRPGHIGEMELLAREYGVASFKIFMFYGSHGLHGRSNSQREFLMLGPGESYDVAHFEFVMRELARLTDEIPGGRDHLSLSLHCELGEILNAYTRIVQYEGELTGLPAYSAARPPHSEGLAIFIASYLANETSCPNINLLHLSSRKAIEAALTMRSVFPHIDFKREVTLGHLLLDTDSPAGCLAKVNPPIRPRDDVERLWRAVLEGDVDWICSDHACCGAEKKIAADRPDDIFAAKSGFGGTEYLLPGLYTEGKKRGMSLGRMAELLCKNPAQRFALAGKGDFTPGNDADVVLLDPERSFVVRAVDSPSSQGYTPFEGLELQATVTRTVLRGETVFADGAVLGRPRGAYLSRPYGVRT